MKIIIALTSLFLITACGGEVSLEDKSENYSYEYTLNNCPTGKQSFSSLEAMCIGLTNDSLNDNCAHSLRCQRFVQDCQQFSIDTSCTP